MIGVLVDVALMTLLLLAVPNLVVFVTGDPERALETVLIQFHQNFFLGPANQVLAGGRHARGRPSRSMAWDPSTSWRERSCSLPIGNGTLGLVEGALSALMFAGTFATLRMAGVSRIIAGAAMTVAVVAWCTGWTIRWVALLQHGAIRFGLPIRGDRRGRGGGVGGLGLLVPARGLQLVGIARRWDLGAGSVRLHDAERSPAWSCTKRRSCRQV